ncbi:hypothetical protein OYT13_13830 [Pandoraea sp. XJJ-1]|uniref:phage tail assembly chaperone n=1 Tax=Pandoraea sp. XJJ-1 TaxID=3002643 RepID=UPI00228200DB|nr:hypothetical protein [Pandoraea sp. XJJ-1]WAL80955.1 hypothetical protein OYT13_13830 [Pandoraea sp. XJJ-1]
MAADIEIRGIKYRVGKLSAMKQLHVSRKIAPLMPAILPIMLKLAGTKKDATDAAGLDDGGKRAGLLDDIATLPQVLQPFADGLANLPDEHADYVIGECLAVVQRFQGNAWFSIWASAAKQPTYDDIDLAVMIELSIKVIVDSLGPFIAGWLISPASHPPTTA